MAAVLVPVAAIAATAATTTTATTTTAAAAAATAAAMAAATAAAVAATATAAVAAATTAAGARRALLGLVHAERTPVHHGAVHLLDRVLGLLGSAHGHEAKAARLAALSVGHDVDVRYLAARRSEGGLNAGLGSGKRKITYVEASTHDTDHSTAP
jgi:hypothetical protein